MRLTNVLLAAGVIVFAGSLVTAEQQVAKPSAPARKAPAAPRIAVKAVGSVKETDIIQPTSNSVFGAAAEAPKTDEE